jgi:DNA-binding beta-propeller fold protein YncE
MAVRGSRWAIGAVVAFAAIGLCAWSVFLLTGADSSASPHSSSPIGVSGSPVASPLALAECAPTARNPAAADDAVRVVRTVVKADGGLPPGAAGAVFIPQLKALLVSSLVQSGDGRPTLNVVSPLGDVREADSLPIQVTSSLALAYDVDRHEVLAVEQDGSWLLRVSTNHDGTPDTVHSPEAIAMQRLGAGPVMGVAAVGEAVYVLRGDGTILRLPRDARAGWNAAEAAAGGELCSIQLEVPASAAAGGLAWDATSQSFIVRSGGSLLQFGIDGSLLGTRRIDALRQWQTVSLLFAPTGDPTDPGEQQNLYAVGGVSSDDSPEILELSLSSGPTIPSGTRQLHIELDGLIDTSRWSPPSSDPSGLAYDPRTGLVVVTDGEVDEQRTFDGANVWEITLAGEVRRSWLTSFTDEPSDVAVDPKTGHRFVTDDVDRRVFEIDPGADGTFGTADDRRTGFDTSTFGCFDPEGIAYGDGNLFIADGLGAQIFRIAPGPDERFNGAGPLGDDIITSFDVGALGQADPEDVAFDQGSGHLLVVSNDRRSPLSEVTVDGALVGTADLSSIGVLAPAGIAVIPTADGSRVMIADRGLDNAVDPRENDGRLFVLRLDAGPLIDAVQNGGFEDNVDGDGAADGWTTSAGVTRRSDGARTGDFILRLDPGMGGIADAKQTLTTVDPDQQYVVTAWFRQAAGRNGLLRIRLSWRDANGATIETARVADVQVAAADWMRVQVRLTAPSAATGARISLSARGYEAVIDIDDITVIPVNG